jgi:hypothetical protein
MRRFNFVWLCADLAEAFKDVDDSEVAPSVTIGDALKAAEVLRRFVQV